MFKDTEDGTTRFADDATLKHMAELEAEVERQAAAIKKLRGVVWSAREGADSIEDYNMSVIDAMDEALEETKEMADGS